MTEYVRTQLAECTFTAAISSIGRARRFARAAAADVIDVIDDRRSELLSDLELAVSELVTNAFQYGLDAPITVSVTGTQETVIVSVRSLRSSSEISDPSTWAGALPAMRTGRGLAIVRAISDEVAVDVDESTVTVHCTFRTA